MYPEDAQLVWAQEEPENQGAWPFMHYKFSQLLPDRKVDVVCRNASASPATGLKKQHDVEQAEVIERVFE